MQRISLAFAIMCCSLDFATSLASRPLATLDKKPSSMMKTFVKISAESLPENDDEMSDKSSDSETEKLVEMLTTTPTAAITTTISSTPTKRQIKLNAKQNIIMNQVIASYGLSGVEDPVCKNHTLEFKRALREFEPWALKMFDSSSKLQAGIFYGNLMDYGSFRQCIEIYTESGSGPIRGQHCTLKITPNDQLLRYVMSYRNISSRRFEKVRKLMLGASLSWSVCVPDSCSSQEVLHHFTKIILTITEGLTLNISIGDYDCYTIKDELPFSRTEWSVIFGFFVLFVVTSVCTAMDVRTQNFDGPKSKMVQIFSLSSNAKKLLAVRYEKRPLDCLNGIRFWSMCYVVMGHAYLMSMFFPLINALDIMGWRLAMTSLGGQREQHILNVCDNGSLMFSLLRSKCLFAGFSLFDLPATAARWVMYYHSTIIIGGTVCVDTFFMITGLLVTYSFFDQVGKGVKFNLPLFYLHRYLRVTPSLMVIVLVNATLIQHLGSGPFWKKTIRVLQKPCQYFWWSTMLHIQNYVNAPYICILPSWYLTCDTQYYFLSPLIIYPLWKWPIFGYALLILCYILSVAISFYLSWVNKYDAMSMMSNRFVHSEYFNHHYITPHTRAAPFIIGIGLGYLLFKTRNVKIVMGTFVVMTGWICSCALLSVSILGTHPFQLEDHDYNRLEHSLFLSITRSAWTLGVAWIVWACRHGYGGPIDYILSFPTYQILGRFSYSVFLMHMGIQFMKQGNSKSPGYFSDFTLIHIFFGDLLMTLFLAFLFTLFIESPIVKAEGILLKKVSRKNDKVRPIIKVQEKLEKENGNGKILA